MKALVLTARRPVKREYEPTVDVWDQICQARRADLVWRAPNLGAHHGSMRLQVHDRDGSIACGCREDGRTSHQCYCERQHPSLEARYSTGDETASHAQIPLRAP